ncbi:MAG: POTRA domain-containing protein, partial [Bacteroidota bacterium]
RMQGEAAPFADAIKKLWKMSVFDEVAIAADTEDPSKVIISVKEVPRLSSIGWKGVNKKEEGQLASKLKLRKGKRISNELRKEIRHKILNYFSHKGYHQTSVALNWTNEKPNSTLEISIIKGRKIKVKEVTVLGNEQIESRKLRKALKPYRRSLGLWKPVYEASAFTTVRQEIESVYKNKGYADIAVSKPIVATDEKGRVSLLINLEEGKQYFIRKVAWEGNQKYSDQELTALSGLKSGMLYDESFLHESLRFRQDGTDISSLYMDKGHLFFDIKHRVTAVEDNMIDLSILIREGEVATIGNVKITGNDITNQHVILRQLQTFPGDQFDRKALIESQSALATLGFFNPNSINVIPVPKPASGTVDLEYTVEEQPNDKYELSGTVNGAIGLTGGIGLVMNNFSSRDLFKFKNWKTLPRGDGEYLALRFNSAGKQYNAFTFNYRNPWHNTEKRTAFFINANFSKIVNTDTDELGESYDGTLHIKGGTVGITKRLLWPDPYFSWSRSVSYQHYRFDRYDNSLDIDQGQSHLFTLNNTISRSKVNHPFYPTMGSSFAASLQLTPPFSLFREPGGQNPYEFAEYAKLMVDYSRFKAIAGKLVLKVGAHFGLIDNYRRSVPLGPFERFHLGGTGLGGQDIFRGNDLIGLRGYPNESLVPADEESGLSGGTVFQKINVELRYPLALQQGYSAYIYGFAEAGNTWSQLKDYNPLNMYRSVGVGMRLSLPFVGQFGVDWAYGFDKLPGMAKPNGGEFHFTIGMPIR